MELIQHLAQFMIPKEHKEIGKTIGQLRTELSEIKEAINLKDIAAKVTDDTIYFTGKAKGFAERKQRNHKFEIYDARFSEGSFVECHSHPEDEIFVLVRGHCVIAVNEVENSVKVGEHVIALGNEVHCLKFTEDSRLITVAVPPLSEFKESANGD